MAFISVFAERKARGEAEMGVAIVGQAPEGHHARVPGRLCAEHYRQEAGHVCALQPGSERQDAAHRLSPASRQGQCAHNCCPEGLVSFTQYA